MQRRDFLKQSVLAAGAVFAAQAIAAEPKPEIQGGIDYAKIGSESQSVWAPAPPESDMVEIAMPAHVHGILESLKTEQLLYRREQKVLQLLQLPVDGHDYDVTAASLLEQDIPFWDMSFGGNVDLQYQLWQRATLLHDMTLALNLLSADARFIKQFLPTHGCSIQDPQHGWDIERNLRCSLCQISLPLRVLLLNLPGFDLDFEYSGAGYTLNCPGRDCMLRANAGGTRRSIWLVEDIDFRDNPQYSGRHNYHYGRRVTSGAACRTEAQPAMLRRLLFEQHRSELTKLNHATP